MKKTTIIIADDHTLIREAWSLILNADPRFRVIAECGSGEEAVTLAKKLRPQVIIMDISLPGINGIEATGLIRDVSPHSKILGVSVHTQPAYAKKMISKGAMGYITKNSSKEEMFTAIGEIQKGNKYICQEIKNILSEQTISGMTLSSDINTLSSREIEIISYLKKGYSSKEIAESLHITTKTVEVHRYNILKKLHLKNTASLINFINKIEPGLG